MVAPLKALIAIAWIAFLPLCAAGDAAPCLRLYLGERVAMVPLDPKVPAEDLPAFTFRAEPGQDGGLVLVAECDHSNLPPEPEGTPPYRVEGFIGSLPGGAKTGFRFDGTHGDEEAAVSTADGSEVAISAQLEERRTGTWRATIIVPEPTLHVRGEEVAREVGVHLVWRLPALSEEGEPIWPDRSAATLTGAGSPARVVKRAVLPTDVTGMLESFAAAPTEACRRRCLLRLVRTTGNAPALRGALALALDHEQPAVRRAAAEVWAAWPEDGQKDTPVLQQKAQEMLEELDPPDPGAAGAS